MGLYPPAQKTTGLPVDERGKGQPVCFGGCSRGKAEVADKPAVIFGGL